MFPSVIELIEDGHLIEVLSRVETANDGLEITEFEINTAAAFLAFSEVPADILLLETGLGGSLTESYSRFVPFQFLELLERNSIEDIDAGDNASLEVSVLFLDIRGFTLLTEKLGPEPTFAWLNSVLSVMEHLIAAENGFINQFDAESRDFLIFPGPAKNPGQAHTQQRDT